MHNKFQTYTGMRFNEMKYWVDSWKLLLWGACCVCQWLPCARIAPESWPVFNWSTEIAAVFLKICLDSLLTHLSFYKCVSKEFNKIIKADLVLCWKKWTNISYNMVYQPFTFRGSLRVFRRIWRCQFQHEGKDEDIFHPLLKNKDVKNSIFSHFE